jgi:phosphoribosylamine--glycine ligase
VRVLVIGSGAREHALCAALSADPAVEALTCAPGNAGIAFTCEVRELPPGPEGVAGLAVELAADLVVIGPEVPLVGGAADAVRATGTACFGPSALAARLEGSKAFAKEVMTSAGVPTAAARVCTDAGQVTAALKEFGPPYVVKDDGLAAGKGVVVTSDLAVAAEHAAGCERVVIEEYLDGPEVSLFVVTDGTAAVPLLPAQDFKRLADGDAGPNTGGMGAYAPLTWLPSSTVDEVMAAVVEPTLTRMRELGTPFSGLLYVGLAMTSRGPRVVEFNCRFGDPETQVVLALLETPLAGLLYAAATGRLAEHDKLRWRDGAAVTVVMASAGYPAKPRLGDPISGLRDASGVPVPGILHAGTRHLSVGHDGTVSTPSIGPDGETVVTAGGRVLAVTATGDDLAAARKSAYAVLSGVAFDGAQYRSDIADPARLPTTA